MHGTSPRSKSTLPEPVERAITEAVAKISALPKGVLFAGIGAIAAFLGSFVGLRANPYHPGSFAHVPVWDAALGLGIGLAVAATQSWSLGRLVHATRDLVKAAAISAGGGFVAGVALILVKTMLTPIFGPTLAHVAAWTAEGGIIAWAVSRAVPNLSTRGTLVGGLAAGFLGGWLSGFGFYAPLADALKGLFIGSAIAVVERLVREAWLEIDRGTAAAASAPGRGLRLHPKTKPTVLLGPDPILVGSTPACQVLVDTDTPGQVLGTLSLRDGRVAFDDRRQGGERSLGDGEELGFGDVTVRVRTRLT